MYKINSEMWTSVFAVPTAVADKHIRLAGAIQIKALLWILRHNGEKFDENDISKAIGYSVDDIKDAMLYWKENGVIVEDGEAIKQPVKKEPEKPVEPKKMFITPKPEKPTNEEITKRCTESEEIKFLFNEVQIKLGRTIGYDTMSNLLLLHDHYGLPVEVILMLVEYCKSVNKTATAYIVKVGKDWGEKEIDTLEKADEQIEKLNNRNTLWKEFCSLTGISNSVPTTAQSKYLDTWSREWGMSMDMIYLAYEEMADHTQKLSFAYMNKILQNWHKNSITTPEAVEKEKQKRFAQQAQTNEPSYDLDEFTRKSLSTPLKYKKEVKN